MTDANRRQRGCFHYRGRRRYRAYKRPNGCWYADYTENRERKRVSLNAKTREEAEEAVRRLDAGPAPGDENEKPTETRRITLIELKNNYIKHKERDKAPRTVARYEAGLDALLRHCQKLGIVMAEDLALPVLEAFEVYRAKDEDCAAKTVYTDCMIIKGFLKYASHPKRGFIAENPGDESWELSKPASKAPSLLYRATRTSRPDPLCVHPAATILSLASTAIAATELIPLNARPEDVPKPVSRMPLLS